MSIGATRWRPEGQPRRLGWERGLRRVGVAVFLGVSLFGTVRVFASPEKGSPKPLPAQASRAAPVREAVPKAQKDRSEPAKEVTWNLPDGPFGAPMAVVAHVPQRAEGERFPVVVVFPGQSEARKPPRRAALGWLEDYELRSALKRIASPPLVAADFRGFDSPGRRQELNQALAKTAYQGLIVVCPSIPDRLHGNRVFAESRVLGKFLVERLLPSVVEHTPALGTRAATGIDGVSLGARAALFIGASFPEHFGAVGGLQSALDPTELERLVEMTRQAFDRNPKLSLRLVTSDRDYYREVNERLSALLTEAGVAHRLLVVKGTHSYRFNRGPGTFELLMFHDRALRGSPFP